jgi:hypothetical protein
MAHQIMVLNVFMNHIVILAFSLSPSALKKVNKRSSSQTTHFLETLQFQMMMLFRQKERQNSHFSSTVSDRNTNLKNAF